MITGIDTHFYLAKDLKRALGFYRDALGLRVDSEFGSGYEFVLPDGSAFGIAQMPGGEWYRCGGVMFAVPDIEAAAEIVRKAGGSIMAETFESPPCFTMWCADTEGNSFALHKRK
ncbi:MAG: hypothetical protein NVSMB31_05850 [Vulcanimicrobiaceae bacterium]